MEEKRASVLLILLLLFSILILILRLHPTIEYLKTFCFYLLSPGPRSVALLVSKVGSVGKNISELASAKEENVSLQKEVEVLKRKEQELTQVLRENEKMRSILGFKERAQWNFIPARVTGRDPYNWYGSIIINQGKEAGIKKGQVVVAPAGKENETGAVGQIVEVSQNTAKVLLLTDSLSSIVGTIHRTGDDGIVEGINGPALVMRYLTSDADVQAGDLVFSSGKGAVFPSGIMVGRIKDSKVFYYQSFRAVNLSPIINLNRLDMVLVMK